ncbi:hypothetical protein P691DRAFT_779643 [Macrolepiota fuliginosa MF-IS2]|uniref:Uncharacterized protein n=1 Tax=Macrolepiota fuliginosa MF-IS2 TaxID=1400762 RepID=A0A9P5X1I7_9AGAR|nr:hypothetical protein P691DRAFT_779643 [Macrolepiota fuliginosa MF-IS2]
MLSNTNWAGPRSTRTRTIICFVLNQHKPSLNPPQLDTHTIASPPNLVMPRYTLIRSSSSSNTPLLLISATSKSQYTKPLTALAPHTTNHPGMDLLDESMTSFTTIVTTFGDGSVSTTVSAFPTSLSTLTARPSMTARTQESLSFSSSSVWYSSTGVIDFVNYGMKSHPAAEDEAEKEKDFSKIKISLILSISIIMEEPVDIEIYQLAERIRGYPVLRSRFGSGPAISPLYPPSSSIHSSSAGAAATGVRQSSLTSPRSSSTTQTPTYTHSSAPSLFRARASESGSIFREGVWPPPGEGSDFVDPFVGHVKSGCADGELGRVVLGVMGPLTPTSPSSPHSHSHSPSMMAPSASVALSHTADTGAGADVDVDRTPRASLTVTGFELGQM